VPRPSSRVKRLLLANLGLKPRYGYIPLYLTLSLNDVWNYKGVLQLVRSDWSPYREHIARNGGGLVQHPTKSSVGPLHIVVPVGNGDELDG
jgi:hypothetical protein